MTRSTRGSRDAGSDGPRCGYPDYRGFLAGVARTLDPFGPRPHWGKIHYMDRQGLQAAFPGYDRFLGIRKKLDPSGAFLGLHLSTAFG